MDTGSYRNDGDASGFLIGQGPLYICLEPIGCGPPPPANLLRYRLHEKGGEKPVITGLEPSPEWLRRIQGGQFCKAGTHVCIVILGESWVIRVSVRRPFPYSLTMKASGKASGSAGEGFP